jgi:polysaccharide export outer membrane protein
LRELWSVLARRRQFIALVMGVLLLACFLYCLIAPKQYESNAKVASRTTPSTSLSLGLAENLASTSLQSVPLQQETLANVFRSDQLAWSVIVGLKLYDEKAFRGRFANRFQSFRPEALSPEAQSYLLERFREHLHVQTIPRTLIVQIRFRSLDGALSAAIVNELIRAYRQEAAEEHLQATTQASAWLTKELKEMKVKQEQDQQALTRYQQSHAILTTPEILPNGQPSEMQHSPSLLQINELEQQLVAATVERILREAEFRAVTQGDPEAVVISDSRLNPAAGHTANGMLEQIHARRSELEQEQARLRIEYGPSFPRVVEIRQEVADLDRQKASEDAKLVERFRTSWQTAVGRETSLLKLLEQRTSEGMEYSVASSQYLRMWQEANSSHEVYMRVLEKAEEAGLAAGVHGTDIAVIDIARQPVKPVTPDLLLDMSITFFVSLWVAFGGVFLQESLRRQPTRAIALLLGMCLAASSGIAQSPPPSAVGFPRGVSNIPTAETKTTPNGKPVSQPWEMPDNTGQQGLPAMARTLSSIPTPAPISAGDQLEVSEFHIPEFHAAVRVSSQGTVTLPLIKNVQLIGLDEQAAAHVIEEALIAQGMLLHPKVFVQVTGYASQDVSVLGEVARPGVYPYAMHHRLLDLISAASGLTPSAGRLVCIFRRNDSKQSIPVVLDPSGMDTGADHNPELNPGDTVQVSRAGLVFVIGNVVRPGGFPVDPAQGLTVVQALSLAWGPSQTAASGKAVLIREQKGGRTMTMLDLKRMLRGQEPDQSVQDRDILYVPESMTKNLLNRTLESALQSAIGVTIYAGLVYSQRF